MGATRNSTKQIFVRLWRRRSRWDGTAESNRDETPNTAEIRLSSLPQIVLGLQIDPKLRCRVERLGQTMSHCRADPRPLVQDG